mmetsp:Transcript_78711/g.245135  ORF Transcript_78711/g.245135 Transcript_78711/m.245135 type:complete len:310 (+) Transcript_78711:1161-2090(+)
MVAHLLALCVRAEGGMLGCHRGDEGLHLHDVVHRSEGQHGLEAFLHCIGCPVWGPHQEASMNKELLDLLPRPTRVIQLALVLLAHLRPSLLGDGRPDGRRRSDHPLVVHTVTEAVLAIYVQAHEPVESEEGTDGPLVLVVRSPLRLHRALAGLWSKVEAELREGRAAVVEEVPQGVALLEDAPRRPGQGLRVRLLVGDQAGERHARALVADGRVRLHREVRRKRHPADRVLRQTAGVPRSHSAEELLQALVVPAPGRGGGHVLGGNLQEDTLAVQRGQVFPGPDVKPGSAVHRADLSLHAGEAAQIREA